MANCWGGGPRWKMVTLSSVLENPSDNQSVTKVFVEQHRLHQGRFHRIYTNISFCNVLNKIHHRESLLLVLDWFILLKSKN